MKIEWIVVGPLETNCFLVYSENNSECVIVDPGAEPDKIIKGVREYKLKPVMIVNTHGHVDHVGANKAVKEEFDIPLYIHESDLKLLKSAMQSAFGLMIGAQKSPPPDGFLKEGDTIELGGSHLEVLHTPGHSPGSISLLGDGFILSGDILFRGGVGRTDLPGGSWEKLKESIKNKIFSLPANTLVLPGHGPSTNVGFEKDSNPYLT
ncbi:MAG: MBL fold metallo-hydrolase [Candidatus Aminicenantes bacterium]|nr:MBL fold metallo-hydrolase [Candidatus Aminicenantes bacterium]